MVDHTSRLRGLGATGDSGAPLILQRTDDDFIGTTLEQLRTKDAYAAVTSSIADTRDTDRTLRLFQPVHRTFNLALVDVYCFAPGFPRLDPSKIDSAGIVIRRVSRRRAPGAQPANPFPQGWLSVGKQLRGWQVLADLDRDPDPLRRPSPTAGHPAIAAQALDRARLVDGAEQVTPLFVAPPDVCAAAGRTILYGMIPTASAEMSESAAPRVSPSDFDISDPSDPNSNLRSVIPRFMRKLNAPIDFGGLAGLTLTGASAAGFTDEDGTPIKDQDDKNLLTELVNFVRFLRISLGAFSGSADGNALLALLDEIALPDTTADIDGGTGRSAADALAAASDALVTPDPTQPASFLLPLQWPAIDQDLADRIYAQVKINLANNLSAAQPGIPRFEDPSARYVVRAFVRVKRDDGCPPELIWTDPSEPFAIVPWYENGLLPPVQIQLPDITSSNVKLLKPNVAFRMPKRLFNFLNSVDPMGLLMGQGQEGSSFGLDWVCSFNISIIFILAFIVMFIFLILLNIVFWWLPFIKICFPIPSFSSREDS